MPGYEELRASLAPVEKALKDTAAAIARHQKAATKDADGGNIADLKKITAQLAEDVASLSTATVQLDGLVNGFDVQQYFESGNFTRELLGECEKLGIDVQGERGVYEMFPFRVRITADSEHPAEVSMNRKKVPSCRPAYVAGQIKASQDKLYDASFKAAAFMSELAEAYTTACVRQGARLGSTQLLNKIYRYMVPTARARRDYDMQAFAFDLARLYEEGAEAWVDKSGVRYQFGTSRSGDTGIRVLSRTGVESYISTLKMINAGE